MTKVEAIKKVLEDNNGAASWKIIYNNIENYYPTAKSSQEWQAGIRGVLYREIRDDKSFKQIGLGLFALKDYKNEEKPKSKDKVRMHSFIEGICIELGNFKNFHTYTADPSAMFKDNIRLLDIVSTQNLPDFTYKPIVDETKRIDVVWLNKKGLKFPQKIFEVVDSLGTLTGAFNRSLQLLNFKTEYYIIAPEKHRNKFEKLLSLEPYNSNSSKFKFINYDTIIELYENASRVNKIESNIF